MDPGPLDEREVVPGQDSHGGLYRQRRRPRGEVSGHHGGRMPRRGPECLAGPVVAEESKQFPALGRRLGDRAELGFADVGLRIDRFERCPAKAELLPDDADGKRLGHVPPVQRGRPQARAGRVAGKVGTALERLASGNQRVGGRPGLGELNVELGDRGVEPKHFPVFEATPEGRGNHVVGQHPAGFHRRVKLPGRPVGFVSHPEPGGGDVCPVGPCLGQRPERNDDGLRLVAP